jgi:hypothetical protein
MSHDIRQMLNDIPYLPSNNSLMSDYKDNLTLDMCRVSDDIC